MPEKKDNPNQISVKSFAGVNSAGCFDEKALGGFRELHALLVSSFQEVGDTFGISKDEKAGLREGIDLYNLGLYEPGARGRRKRSLIGSSPVVVLDIDAVNLAGLDVIKGIFEDVEYILYPTQSCPPIEPGNTLRFRMLISTDRPFTITREMDQYKLVVGTLLRMIQAEIDAVEGATLLIDEASERATQIYYYPCGSAWKREAVVLSEGSPLGLDQITDIATNNELAHPQGTTRDPAYRRLDHTPGFRAACENYLKKFLAEIASRPKEDGTYMYDLKNHQPYTLAGMSASGALSVNRDTLLNKILDAHTKRLKGWGEENIEETTAVIEKAFDDGYQNPLYGSIADESIRLTLYPETRDTDVDTGDDSDRSTLAEIVGYDPKSSTDLSRLSLLVEHPTMMVEMFEKWLKVRYQEPDRAGKYHPLVRTPVGSKNALLLFERGATYWRKSDVGVGLPAQHKNVANAVATFLEEVANNFAQSAVEQEYKRYQDSVESLIQRAQSEIPSDIESAFPAMKEALMHVWAQSSGMDASKLRKKLLDMKDRLASSYLANNPMMPKGEDSAHRLPFNNGVLNMRTMRLEPGCPEDYFTHAVPCEYNSNSTCPAFEAFLARCFPEQDVAEYVEKLLGMSLVGGNAEQKIYFHIGKGANGKSVLQSALNSLLGDFCHTVPNESIKRNPGDSHPALQAEFAGLRVAQISELERNDQLNVPRIKALVGDTEFRARKLHADYETFQMEATIMVASNYMPVLADEDPAVWRRVEVIPWTQVIPENERDPRLAKKLVEKEAAGILAKLSRRAHEYLIALAEDRTHEYLKVPEAVRAATERERRGCNRALAWLQSAGAQRDYKLFNDPSVTEALTPGQGGSNALPEGFCTRIEKLWEAYCKYTRNAATRLPPYESVERFILGMEQLGFRKSGEHMIGICEADAFRLLVRGGAALN